MFGNGVGAVFFDFVGVEFQAVAQGESVGQDDFVQKCQVVGIEAVYMDLVAAALEGLIVQLLPYACLGGKHLGQDFCAACDVEYGVVCNMVFGTVGFEDGVQPHLDFFGSFAEELAAALQTEFMDFAVKLLALLQRVFETGMRVFSGHPVGDDEVDVLGLQV